MEDTVSVVERLKRRLSEATCDASSEHQEEAISKVLKRLSVLPMSLEILQVTQIGRHVNQLRKWKTGKVSSRARALVKQWKQLLPEAAEREEANTSVSSGESCSRDLSYGVTERWERQTSPTASMDDRHHSSLATPTVRVESGGDSEESVVEIGRPSTHSKKHHHPKEKKKKKKKRAGHEDTAKEALSRTFEMALDPSCGGGGRSLPGSGGGGGGGGGVGVGRRAHKDGGEDVLIVGSSSTVGSRKRSRSPMVVPVGGVREKSPSVLPHAVSREPATRFASSGPTLGVKRKAVDTEPQVAIAQSKRSRTQVYSGKKTHGGPQVVSSLFDMCMKILIDNIDVIEEVGAGVPYHVLEPLLVRCSAAQLMKLEDFNPHLVEDTESLWRKHVVKDFKVTKLPSQYTWRELYREQVAEREEKLKNLTARIKANNHAREEPVRKVKMATATVKPGRRSGVRRGGFSRPMERPQPGTELMKRTMKMAKERNHMVGFRGKR